MITQNYKQNMNYKYTEYRSKEQQTNLNWSHVKELMKMKEDTQQGKLMEEDLNDKRFHEEWEELFVSRIRM